MTANRIDETLARLSAAERAGDAAALEELLTDDFELVGPLGFVLDKPQWIAQYRAGNLAYSRLEVEPLSSRTYGDVALVIGTRDQEATYQGTPTPARLRMTAIVVADGDRRRLAGLQFSPIAPPPGATTAPSAGETR
jgi:ketosteroid isomerase-like protein